MCGHFIVVCDSSYCATDVNSGFIHTIFCFNFAEINPDKEIVKAYDIIITIRYYEYHNFQ